VRVVPDPNVLVSAVVRPEGVCAELLARLVEGAVVIVVSPLLLSEVERVLARPKFQRIFGLPFLLQWSLGGFIDSGAVMLWAILAPVGRRDGAAPAAATASSELSD
jgi:hypothetical protein